MIPSPQEVARQLDGAAESWLQVALPRVAAAVARWEPGRKVTVELDAPVPSRARERIQELAREAGWRVLHLDTGHDQREGDWARLELDAGADDRRVS